LIFRGGGWGGLKPFRERGGKEVEKQNIGERH
jgi:hypothetical protein